MKVLLLVEKYAEEVFRVECEGIHLRRQPSRRYAKQGHGKRRQTHSW